MDIKTLYGLGIALMLAGTIVIIVTVLLLLLSHAKDAKVKGSGVIIVGPFPIIFGTDKESVKTVLILSVVLTAIAIVAIVVFYFMSR